ncbi:MAG: hypothetical protein IKH54_01690 [Bacilli bacterium]|nr:hypothetical protein [Bacilli bacterium]
MQEADVYVINDKEYILLNKIKNKENTYLYFSNISEGNDYIIRKLDLEDEDSMVPLDDEKEVQKAILLLTNRQLEL